MKQIKGYMMAHVPILKMEEDTYSGFCKLTLNDGTIVELEGSGELTQAMVSNQYEDTLVSAEIGELCTSIGMGAFSNCTGLESITMPDSIISIGMGAFSGCSSLTSVTIPDSVVSIRDSAFNGCSGLISATISDSVTSIGNGAFNGCSSLTSVTIGSGVISIGQAAFSYCNNLSTITSHIMNAPSVNSGTFG